MNYPTLVALTPAQRVILVKVFHAAEAVLWLLRGESSSSFTLRSSTATNSYSRA